MVYIFWFIRYDDYTGCIKIGVFRWMTKLCYNVTNRKIFFQSVVSVFSIFYLCQIRKHWHHWHMIDVSSVSGVSGVSVFDLAVKSFMKTICDYMRRLVFRKWVNPASILTNTIHHRLQLSQQGYRVDDTWNQWWKYLWCVAMLETVAPIPVRQL